MRKGARLPTLVPDGRSEQAQSRRPSSPSIPEAFKVHEPMSYELKGQQQDRYLDQYYDGLTQPTKHYIADLTVNLKYHRGSTTQSVSSGLHLHSETTTQYNHGNQDSFPTRGRHRQRHRISPTPVDQNRGTLTSTGDFSWSIYGATRTGQYRGNLRKNTAWSTITKAKPAPYHKVTPYIERRLLQSSDSIISSQRHSTTSLTVATPDVLSVTNTVYMPPSYLTRQPQPTSDQHSESTIIDPIHPGPLECPSLDRPSKTFRLRTFVTLGSDEFNDLYVASFGFLVEPKLPRLRKDRSRAALAQLDPHTSSIAFYLDQCHFFGLTIIKEDNLGTLSIVVVSPEIGTAKMRIKDNKLTWDNERWGGWIACKAGTKYHLSWRDLIVEKRIDTEKCAKVHLIVEDS